MANIFQPKWLERTNRGRNGRICVAGGVKKLHGLPKIISRSRHSMEEQ